MTDYRVSQNNKLQLLQVQKFLLPDYRIVSMQSLIQRADARALGAGKGTVVQLFEAGKNL